MQSQCANIGSFKITRRRSPGFARFFLLVRMLTLCLTMLSTLLTSHSTRADSIEVSPAEALKQPFKEVAIAIATPGPGASILGHAFLLFLNDRSRLSESVAVQFNLDTTQVNQQRAKLPETLETAISFLGMDKRFVGEASPGLSMMNRYRAENRAVILYFIDFTPAQIESTQNHLVAEIERRAETPLFDYQFQNRNCLTESLRALNVSIDDEQKRFDFIDIEDRLRTMLVSYTGFTLFVKNAPYAAAPAIAKHPLVKDKAVIVPELVAEAKLLTEFVQAMVKLGRLAGSLEKSENVAVRVAAQPRLRDSAALFSYVLELKSQAETHNKDEASAAFKETVEKLYLLSNTIESRMRLQRYLR